MDRLRISLVVLLLAPLAASAAGLGRLALFSMVGRAAERGDRARLGPAGRARLARGEARPGGGLRPSARRPDPAAGRAARGGRAQGGRTRGREDHLGRAARQAARQPPHRARLDRRRRDPPVQLPARFRRSPGPGGRLGATGDRTVARAADGRRAAGGGQACRAAARAGCQARPASRTGGGDTCSAGAPPRTGRRTRRPEGGTPGHLRRAARGLPPQDRPGDAARGGLERADDGGDLSRQRGRLRGKH